MPNSTVAMESTVAVRTVLLSFPLSLLLYFTTFCLNLDFVKPKHVIASHLGESRTGGGGRGRGGLRLNTKFYDQARGGKEEVQIDIYEGCVAPLPPSPPPTPLPPLGNGYIIGWSDFYFFDRTEDGT